MEDRDSGKQERQPLNAILHSKNAYLLLFIGRQPPQTFIQRLAPTMVTKAELLIPNPPKMMSDDQWFPLAKRFRLPTKARNQLNSAILFLIIGNGLDYAPGESKATLRDLTDLSAKFRGGIKKLFGDRLALQRLRTAAAPANMNIPVNHLTTQNGLADTIAHLEQFEEFLQNAAASVPKARPGARSKAVILAFAVSLLDEIYLKSTGKHLERNSKGNSTGRDFVAAICHIAGLNVGPGSIDEALKRVIKGHGEITSATER